MDKNTLKKERGAKLKQMRLLMGVKQVEMSEFFGKHQSNYSSMEKGILKVPEHLMERIKTRFYSWKIDEIKKLNEKIDFLNNI